MPKKNSDSLLVEEQIRFYHLGTRLILAGVFPSDRRVELLELHARTCLQHFPKLFPVDHRRGSTLREGFDRAGSTMQRRCLLAHPTSLTWWQSKKVRQYPQVYP